MQYFTIPAPIQVVDSDGKKVKMVNDTMTAEVDMPITTFYRYLCDHLLQDKKIVATFKAITAGGDIQVATKDLDPGQRAAIETAHWDILKTCIEVPDQMAGKRMSPDMARCYRPFMEAIMKANEKSVEEVKDTEEAS